ncbi:MAG: hypothetical protein QY332_15435 [Anaerolineales bacterium]|nr:MAG: hypothetical protein QY332_15435 [Anaerolineales bacterium]
MSQLNGCWYVGALRRNHASDGSFQTLIAVSIDRDCQGDPGFAILPVDNQCDRTDLLLIDKEDDHLTVAIRGSMMGAGTIWVSKPGILQIEGLYDAEPSPLQLIVDQCQDLVTWLIENQKWE